MKRGILIIMVISFIVGFVWADGTVRTYTKTGWYFCNSNSPVPPSGPWVPAPTINHYFVTFPTVVNQWDFIMSLIGTNPFKKPLPWEKLYKQTLPDSAYWIGVSPDGADIFVPDSRDTIWFLSPSVIISDPTEISRATIWLSCDDYCDRIYLVLDDGTAYLLPVSYPIQEFDSLTRMDITDALREFLMQFNKNKFRIEYRIINSAAGAIGMISYFSADYGAPVSYHYSLTSTSGYDYITMPFKTVDPAATLSSLFPGIFSAWFWSWKDNSYHSINTHSPLTGEIGDTVRTFLIVLSHSAPIYTIIQGYPVFEQRYLDITTNYYFGLGTITMRTCEPGEYGFIPFADNEPDDFRDWKITGDATSQCIGSSWLPGVSEIREGNAYFTLPHPTTPGHPTTEENLPYHLDLIKYKCKFPAKAAEGDEHYSVDDEAWANEEETYRDTIYIDSIIVSEEDWARMREIDERVSLIPAPDSSDIREYRARLDSISRIPVSGPPPLPPGFSEGEFHKESILQSVPDKLSISAYPSPFNSSVSISISVPSDDYIDIEIYDAIGNLVCKLFSGNTTSGTYSFIWDGKQTDGSSANSGVYFVRASSSTQKVQTKIILMK